MSSSRQEAQKELSVECGVCLCVCGRGCWCESVLSVCWGQSWILVGCGGGVVVCGGVWRGVEVV